jgi:hypothetical protein
LRFAGIDIGATSIDVAVTNGELEILGHVAAPCDVHEGPNVVLDRALGMVDKLRGVPAIGAARDREPADRALGTRRHRRRDRSDPAHQRPRVLRLLRSGEE